MYDVLSLALPFFGLIFLGFVAGKLWKKDEEGLAWLNIFVIYFALPALFFQLISKTPIDQLANWRYVFTTSLATYTAFALAFSYAAIRNRGNLPEATIQGMVGGYGNVGYMGPPLAILALGPEAAVPAALIFCFDVALCFTLAPLMMAVTGNTGQSVGRTLISIPGKVLLHPFIIATMIGVAAAAIRFEPPAVLEQLLTFLRSSAAPCALFALGVTVALRPLKKVPGELPVLILIKLLIHPLIVYLLLSWVGGFDSLWVYTAVLMACLPPAATIYVLATQYDSYILRASSAILIGTAVSVVTVTLVLYLVTENLLPDDPISLIQGLMPWNAR